MPSYKLRNFKQIKTINGIEPDESGNIVIIGGSSEVGYAYLFKEENFLVRNTSVTLTYLPLSQVPLTVTINGLVCSRDNYFLTGKIVRFPEGSVEDNDIVRIMYAHGG